MPRTKQNPANDLDEPTRLRRFLDAFEKSPRGAKIGTTLLLLSFLDSVAFLIWRWDKPANNPGGPLQSMGPWVLAWQVFNITLRGIGTLTILLSCSVAAHRREQAEKRTAALVENDGNAHEKSPKVVY